MANLKPKFHQPAAADAKSLLDKILALCDFVLTSFTDRGRSTKAIDQIVDRFWSGQATRVNKAREAKALATGQTSYTKVNAYDAMKGVYQGNTEYLCTETDAVNLIDRICKAAGIQTYVSPETAEIVFNGLTERYAAHPEAQKYITLDDLEDELIESLDPKPPSSTNGASNSSAKKSQEPAHATV